MPAPNVSKTKTGKVKPAKKLSLEERVKNDPALLRRVLKNPGQRSKLPAKYLTPALRRQREMNERLRQPITPGSTTTERELARESGAATDVRYGPLEAQQKLALGTEQTRARDVGSFYDDYLRRVAAHAQNVQNISTATNAAMTGIQNNVTGLAGADLTQLNQRATADAAARGATPGDLAQMASNATAVRQGLVGSFAAQQAATGAANQNYASGQANLVAPGQKLQAQAQASGRVREAEQARKDTARERGAYETQFRAERRSEEAKQVLARQTLAGNLAEDKTDAEQEAARIRETTRHNRASEQAANQRIADARSKAVTQAQNAGNKRSTTGPFAGLTANQINALSDKDARKLVEKYNAKPGEKDSRSARQKYEDDFYKKYGVQPATSSDTRKAQTSIGEAKQWLNRLTGGKNKKSLAEAGQLLTTGGAIKGGGTLPKLDAVLVRAAMDVRQHGGVTPGTAHRLHKAGYSVKQLGLPTASKPAKKPEWKPGGSLGGFPKTK